MKLKKRTLITDVPAVATGDIAFNLIVFFLVCASSQPTTGRKQDIPRADTKQQQQEKSKNIELRLTAREIAVNGKITREESLKAALRELLIERKQEADKVVLVRSAKDTPYERWIKATTIVEEAGGSITLQLEEEQQVAVP